MTDRKRDNESRLSVLAELLDAYGADPARWPGDRRGDAEALLARGDAVGNDARGRLREARALDGVLEARPQLDGNRLAALAARIAVEAAGVPQHAKVIAFPVAKVSTGRAAVGRPLIGSRWAAAAVLAASLMVGIAIGPGTTGLPALRDAADAFGLGGIADQLAQAPVDDFASGDEDVL